MYLSIFSFEIISCIFYLKLMTDLMQANHSVALLLYQIMIVGCVSYSLHILEGKKIPLCSGSCSDIS